MKLVINEKRIIGKRSPLIYGHFIEHFHRQIYNGIYDPESKFADEDGIRTDIVDAMKKIKVPILRWPGGCFVSSYHWKDAVGKERKPLFDKAWRVEDPNSFGTDEYVNLCRKIGCEPYICTNAGTGTSEEMSDWVEYCNLKNEGQYAKNRIANGHVEPYAIKYWSIGNENYGRHEIGAKTSEEWGILVREAAKMMKHVDPKAELSAAAISDLEWNVNLLKHCGQYLDWISLHEYWDMLPEKNNLASYDECMAYTEQVDHTVKEVRGLLQAMKLEKKIKIAFDEWNLRGWHHPNVHTIIQGISEDEYIKPRDLNDDNSQYTMADAVFTACFLNAMNRNCDIVKMANFAPILNTRGCIFSYKDGIVLRSTYYVFYLYVNYLGDTVIDSWTSENIKLSVKNKQGEDVTIDKIDMVATKWSEHEGIAIAIVNKSSNKAEKITLELDSDELKGLPVKMYSISGSSTDSYNDIDKEEIVIDSYEYDTYMKGTVIPISPHSVNIIHIANTI